MKYDFITAPNRRNSGSSKWEGMKGLNPNVPEGVVPLSVADMELKNPPEILEGLKAYLDQAVLGYPCGTDSFYEAVESWTRRRYGWETKREWLITTPGIVNAFHQAVLAYTEPGDGVILLTPVYYPFSFAVSRNDRKEVRCPLVNINGRYEIDYELLEEMAGKPENKLIIFCSPHNPVGRVWTRDELENVGRICIDNDVFIVSDEIHCDLIMPGYEHTVMANISSELEAHTMTCIAPSKTFNLAGMQSSCIFIPDEEKRGIYMTQLLHTAQSNRLSVLGYKSTELAYTRCDGWLEECIQLLVRNRKAVEDFIEKELPQIKVTPLEGTYLMWLDCRELGIDYKELERINVEEAYFFTDEGYIFGPEGEGFERINIACPTEVLTDALKRMAEAYKKHMKL